MNVLLTIAIVVGIAAWIATVVRRLDRMREQIKVVWQRLEADQSNEAVKTVYNKHVAAYNAALESFPAYVVAPLVGLKPARLFH